MAIEPAGGVPTFSRTELGPPLLAGLRPLLEVAFDDAFDDHDFDHCLGGTHHLLRPADRLLSHASVVPRQLHVGSRTLRCGYVEAVATLPSYQRRGLGRAVMVAAGRTVRERYEAGALSTGSPAFYEQLGWQRWRGPSHVVIDGRWVRTADEDDGVMVLVPEGLELDLTDPIAVEDRPGDAW